MTTALTVYFSNEASGTLSTANKLYSASGTPTDANNATKLGTATGWGEIYSQGTTNAWGAGASEPAPAGVGFLWDVTTLEGNDLIAGAYTASVRLNMVGAGAVNITSDIHARLYKRSSGGAYTLIGTCALTGQTIKTTKTVFSLPLTTSANTSFATGDKLAVSITCNVTHNTGPSTASIQLNDLSTDTVTHTGSTTAQIVTPGYVTTGGGGGGNTDNPYGVTIGHPGASGTLDQSASAGTAIADMQALGITWLRLQIPWSAVDATGTTNQNTATYTWSVWDDAVTQCNAASPPINIILTIFKAPAQFQTGSNPDAPSYTATFATQIATRYDGGHGHGTIQGIEVGNEDYDNSSGTSAVPLVATMNAVYPAVKGVLSSIKVGCAALLQRNSAHYTSFMETLLNPSTGAYSGSTFQGDYINFHFYCGIPTSGGKPVNLDPTVSIPSWNGGAGLPSITDNHDNNCAWKLIQNKMAQYNLSMPVWVTETGWQINTNPGRNQYATVSQNTQWQYLQDVLDACRTSQVVNKVFVFTLGYYDGYGAPNYRDGMSLVQGTLGSPTHTVAYTNWASYTTQYPQWTSGGGSTGTISAAPSTLVFAGTIGSADPASQSVTVSNSDSSSASYTATSNASWLTVSPASGTISAGSHITSTVSASIGSLPANTYSGTITYSASQGTSTVTVSFVVSPQPTGGTTLTNLTLYFTGLASATLLNANQLYINTSASPTDTNNASLLGAATGWGEVTSQSTSAAWAAAASQPTPTGLGFIWDSTALESNSLQPGTYTGAVRLNMIGSGAVSITADVHARLFKYTTSTGIYTPIADTVLAGQTITTTKTVFAPVFTTTDYTNFGVGEKLYIDILCNVTANTNTGTVSISLNNLSLDVVGQTGSTSADVATPGYAPTSSGGTGGTGGGANPNSVQINGQEVFVVAGTLQIDSAIGRRSSARFQVKTDTNTHFQQYMPVQVFDSNTALAFSGYVSKPRETKPGFQPSLVHDIQAIDQHYLADKRIIAASYTNKTCGFMATDIFNNYLAAEGVQIGQIYDGPTPSNSLYPSTTLYPGGNVGLIPSAVFSYCTAAQALDELVKQASAAGIPYYWMIDQNLLLWFVPYTAVVNGNVVDGTLIDRLNRPPYVIRANPLYRNTQYITGGYQQTVQQTEIHVGDGQSRSWTLGYQVSVAPTVSVNLNGGGYTQKTVGIKGSSGSDFYWAAGDNVIVQDSGGAVLRGPTGTVDDLKVVYYGQYPSVVSDTNAAQVSYMSALDGSSGIIEAVTDDKTITSLANGLSEASQFLTRYAQQGTQLVFATRVSGYAQGQLITVNLPMFNLASAQMLIESVSATDTIDRLNIWYIITAVLGPYDIGWVQFFSTLLAQQSIANSVNLGVGASVPLSATFTASPTITATLSVSVYACPIPNTSLQPATNLYPC